MSPTLRDDASDQAPAEQAAPQDPDFEAFETVCRRLAGFHPGIDVSWVDGYLTALAATCRAVPPPEWLPRLADDAFERAFADPVDAAGATQALQRWLARRRAELDPQRLLDEPDRCFLTPLFDEWTEDDREQLRAAVAASEAPPEADPAALQTGFLWASGFLDAVEDFRGDWPEPRPDDDSAEADGYRAMMQLLAGVAATVEGASFAQFMGEQWRAAKPTRDELLDEVCFAVQDLRLYGLDHMPGPAPRRVAAVPGRNDPCPCGSGLKYKKCHGA
jgi:uncharacterized protein